MKKQSSTAHELLKIADKLPGLIKPMDKPSHEVFSLIGRVAGVENDKNAIWEMIIDLAKHGFYSNDDGQADKVSFCSFQTAVNFWSDHLWEQLWNEKHSDRYGKAWNDDAEDFDLMEVWRTKVRETLKECRQDFILVMTYGEYVARLIEGGATEDDATAMADGFLANLLTEDEKDALNARETTGVS